jgi:hypothetical protein
MAGGVWTAADAVALAEAAAPSVLPLNLSPIMVASGHPAKSSRSTPFRTESCQET